MTRLKTPPSAALEGRDQDADAVFRLAAIVESSSDAIIGKTLDGVITSWNRGAEHIFGYSAAEIIGRNVSILIPADRQGEETRILAAIGRGERIEHYQTVRRRKDGTNVDISLTVSPVRDAEGRIIGASKIARNISTEVREQELRRRSEELVANSIDAIYRVSLDSDDVTTATIQTWNRAAELLFGYTGAEVIGKPLTVLIPVGLRAQEFAILARLQRGGHVESYEATVRTKSGEDVVISLTTSPLRDARGRLVAVAKIARDISAQKRAEASLRQSEALKTGLLNAGLDAIVTVDKATRVIEFNAAAERIFGYTRAGALGKPIAGLIIPPRHREAVDRGVARYLATGESGILGRHVEMSAMRADGSEFPCELAIFRVPLDGPPMFTASMRDITERRRAEEAARESEEQFRTLADNIANFAWIADAQGSIYWYNKRWYDYTGATLEDVRGFGWTKFHHPDHIERAVEHYQSSLESGEPWEDVFPLRGKDGEYRWFLSRALPIRDKSGRIARWLGTNTDVTEQRKAEEALRHGALHDPLTDLPNRAYFVERLSQAFARLQRDPDYRIAVLLLDCDGFKSINDTLGHQAGDKFLMEIGARLRATVRPGDVVARLGGDEFTVLLEDVTGPSDADRAARHIQQALAAPFMLEGRPVVATVSIGAAISETGDGRPQDLLHHADLAMYHAKRQGRARFELFSTALGDSAKARVDMERDLSEAVARKQFRLVFQPIVELETGKVRSVEALLRWTRPRREAVTPLDIVAAAERTGLILEIGRWVLREACRNALAWQHASPSARPTRVSVNLSAKQFWDAGLVSDIRSAAQETGVPLSVLVLEISEGVVSANVEAARKVLQGLRESGLAVVIDDFGTDASLIHLSRFPVEGIKLDRALVHRMGARRTENFELPRSIMDLARSLSLTVTAEGVETAAQRDRLIALGCALGQGYLFAKPLEPKDAKALLAEAA